jgi:hypothetical protein
VKPGLVKPETALFLEKSHELLERADTMMGVGLTDDGGRAAYLLPTQSHCRLSHWPRFARVGRDCARGDPDRAAACRVCRRSDPAERTDTDARTGARPLPIKGPVRADSGVDETLADIGRSYNVSAATISRLRA